MSAVVRGHDVHECTAAPRTGSPRSFRGYATGKSDYLVRLRKIEGQVRGLQRMIDDDRWCPEVVTQISSVNRALQEVAIGLTSDHLRHCVMDAARLTPDEGAGMLDEVSSTLRQIVRL